MTREEAIAELKYARSMTEFDPMTGEVGFRNDEDKRQAEAFDMAIKALEQQSSEDWYDVPSCEMTLEQARQAVKDLRKKLAEYLEQKPTAKNDLGVEDCVSRADVLQILLDYDYANENALVLKDIKALPPVTPQPKTGHWIDIMAGDMLAQACDQCNTFYPLAYTGGGHKYCPNCGCRMESEVQDTLAIIKENGKWLYKEGYNGKLKCNQCNHFITIGTDSNYCPNCGAKMEAAESEIKE